MVLYDVDDRRGWLVDGASALLHISRAKLSAEPFASSSYFEVSEFHHADPTKGLAGAAETLLDQRNRDIIIDEETETWKERSIDDKGVQKTEIKVKETPWRFEKLVRKTWQILEQIHDYQTKLSFAPGIGLRGTDRDKLEGFGLRNIIEGDNPLQPRVSILKPSGRGWVDFTRDIHAITLLDSGLGELIKPATSANSLCNAWASVPTDKDYLVACISTLQQIYKKSGNKQTKDSLELAQGIYWHKGAALFEGCSNCKPNRLGTLACDRVQVLLPPSLGPKRHPSPFMHEKGAVIFGRSAKYRWSWKNFGDPKPRPEDATDSDEEEDAIDSGIGTESRGESSMAVDTDSGIATSVNGTPAAQSDIFAVSNASQVSTTQNSDHKAQVNMVPRHTTIEDEVGTEGASTQDEKALPAPTKETSHTSITQGEDDKTKVNAIPEISITTNEGPSAQNEQTSSVPSRLSTDASKLQPPPRKSTGLMNPLKRTKKKLSEWGRKLPG